MPRPKPKRIQVAKQRFLEIKDFVKFKVNTKRKISAKKARKIKHYWDEYQKLISRPYQIYRPRNKNNLAVAQRYAGDRLKYPEFVVAFIPTNGEDTFKVRVTPQGKLVLKTKHVTTYHVDLRSAKFVKNPEQFVEDAIKKVKADEFGIQAGAFEIPHRYSKDLIASRVARLAVRYSKSETANEKNHHFSRWLHGLNSYTFSNQDTAINYAHKKYAAKVKLKKANKKIRHK